VFRILDDGQSQETWQLRDQLANLYAAGAEAKKVFVYSK
jgi:hypothetical protein